MNSRIGLRAILCAAAALALYGAGATAALAQQTGTIQGTVVDATTSRPLPAAQIQVVGTQLGTLTNQQGRYQLVNVPAGTHTVRVELVGYGAVTRNVTVVAGEAITANVQLTQTAIALQEVVVTGVAGATVRAKLPFTVDQITAQNLPVPAVSAGSAIQGKVAGAQVVQGSGRPGAAPSILLRGPTMIDATGRDQEPLYIVDGVVLGSSMVDIDALDIENIEVVKGAAAASMYGSRAASGVVNITTRRGRGVQEDMARWTVRSEMGRSELGSNTYDFAQFHQFMMNENQTAFIGSDGNEYTDFTDPAYESRPAGNRRIDETRTAGSWNTVQSNPWPGGTFDHVDRFFDPGTFSQQYLSVEGRSGATNYHVSYSNLRDQGVVLGQDGFKRNNFRINLDHGLQDNLQISASAFFSRSHQDQFPESQGNPLFTLTRQPAGVDLMRPDPSGDTNLLRRRDEVHPILQPDRFNENANPLYELLNRRFEDDRQRFLGSANLRYSPVQWFDVDGQASLDRLDLHRSDYYPRGFKTVRTSATNQGHVRKVNQVTEAFNASVTGTVRQSFGELFTRTQVRALFEEQDFGSQTGWGYNLVVQDVPSLTAARDSRVTRSTEETVRSLGYFFITNFEYGERYILDALVRRDGSSLFGADNRWHTYFRAAAAWRMAQEPWWPLQGTVTEFKPRFSIGTAGGRPNFWAQYETYTVQDGSLSPSTLGNRDLAPEYSIEQEAGLDIAFLDRFTLSLTYANTETRDQILNVPLPAFTGFTSQWRNAGTLESNTWEASLDALLYEGRDVRWSARVLYDRTRQEITELNVPAFQYGVGGQGMDAVFYARPGESLGTFYGRRLAQTCNDLPMATRGNCDTHFDRNNDGYLVFVGEGRTWRDGWNTFVDGEGVEQTFWGSTGSVAGRSFQWGTPVIGEDDEGNTFLPIGSTQPDYSISLSNTLSWRGLTVYGLLDAVQGFSVYNQPRQWSTFQQYAGLVDQAGVPEAEQKPIGYFDALYGGLAPTNTHWVEDGSFVKLREVALRYRFGRDQLSAIPFAAQLDGIGLSLVGRNLLTWTNYTGYDPEVGRTTGATGQANPGSAALARVDGYGYPNFRTFTAAIEINF